MRQHRAGFTLAEVLVSTAITSVLMVGLFGLVSASLGVWEQGRGRIETMSSARVALRRMGDEISGAVARKDRVEFVENDPGLGGSAVPVAGKSENIFFVAPYPNSGSGDLCVVAYRRDPATNALQRAFKNSEEVWDTTSTATDRYKLTSYTPAGTLDWRPVVAGVIEFEVVAYSQADLDNGSTPAPTWNSAGTDTNMQGQTPRSVQLRLKVVDSKALARIGLADPSGTAFQRMVAQSARTFQWQVTLATPVPSL